jgi:hypothetical protein
MWQEQFLLGTGKRLKESEKAQAAWIHSRGLLFRTHTLLLNKEEQKGKISITIARHCGSCLQFQHSGSWGRRTSSLRPAWTSWWDPVSKREQNLHQLFCPNLTEATTLFGTVRNLHRCWVKSPIQSLAIAIVTRIRASENELGNKRWVSLRRWAWRRQVRGTAGKWRSPDSQPPEPVRPHTVGDVSPTVFTCFREQERLQTSHKLSPPPDLTRVVGLYICNPSY